MKLTDAGIYDIENIFKGKATNAHNMSQGKIINNKARQINIPAYQRPYRWNEQNIRNLFSDYNENESEYFIGSTVVIEKHRNDTDIEYDIVDGQQRITTLYLTNYIRYLLKREYILDELSKPYQPKSTEYCKSLKDIYVDLVGKQNKPFDNILAMLDNLSNEEGINNPDDRVDKLISCYKSELCIAEKKLSEHETLREIKECAKKFLSEETLCLKYSRKRYNDVLKEALCSVYISDIHGTSNLKLYSNVDDGSKIFLENYITAMQTIFDEIWKKATELISKPNPSKTEICESAINYVDKFMQNMAVCIVLTESENDANKLFEVLNNRSLEVEDLELIKNHFYKEYCTKSSDDEETKDNKITELDALWTDKIFDEGKLKKNRLISYLTAVYLTSDKELIYKDDSKLKDAIDKNYSSKNTAYEYSDLKADFNTYLAIKIILNKFMVGVSKKNVSSLNSEQDETKSISYRTIQLLNALGYTSVMPAIVNVILANYRTSNSMIDDSFEANFSQYIDELLNDNKHTKEEFKDVHKCSYYLWVSSIKGDDHTISRNIAKRIIEKNGHIGLDNSVIYITNEEEKKLNCEFERWLNDWSYKDKKSFVIKILMLHLLTSDREEDSDGFRSSVVKINLNTALTYKLDAGKLQLDHLEANVVNEANAEKYYKSDDRESRQNDVNNYLGNFMILDATDNNQKNNVPLNNATKFYKRIEKSWMIEDIKAMIKDNTYFDSKSKIPNETFFKTRSTQLKEYFKALVNNDLCSNTFEVKLK